MKLERIKMKTNGAGPCVVAADLVQYYGLRMTYFSASTKEVLERSFLDTLSQTILLI